MRTIEICGTSVPVLGQGTWRMGESPAKAKQEARALLAGLDAGMTLVDTAEMYGGGGTESFLGEALAGRRDEVFLVSKAYPQNASRARLQTACEASLRRLGTDRLDLYLLHWPGSVPIGETAQAIRQRPEGFDVDLATADSIRFHLLARHRQQCRPASKLTLSFTQH